MDWIVPEVKLRHNGAYRDVYLTVDSKSVCPIVIAAMPVMNACTLTSYAPASTFVHKLKHRWVHDGSKEHNTHIEYIWTAHKSGHTLAYLQLKKDLFTGWHNERARAWLVTKEEMSVLKKKKCKLALRSRSYSDGGQKRASSSSNPSSPPPLSLYIYTGAWHVLAHLWRDLTHPYKLVKFLMDRMLHFGTQTFDWLQKVATIWCG